MKKYTRMIHIFFISLLLLSVENALANNGWKLSSNNLIENSDFSEKTFDAFVDDVTSENDIKNIELSKDDLRLAKVWGISNTEMQRYKILMSNKNGTYYKNKGLSPVEILGINARDNIERNKFANLLMKHNIQRISKELAFEKAYNTNYKNHVIRTGQKTVNNFDTNKYSPYSYKAVDLNNDDTLMMFIKKDEEVNRIISPILSNIYENDKVSLNIYLMDQNLDKETIYTWAKKHNISPELVSSKRITLNIGNKEFHEINPNNRTPSLYVVRDGITSEVDLERF